MSSQPTFFLVIDLEATCDDAGSVPKNVMEIIEIGAVLVDAATMRAVDEFGAFVRPVLRPTLTPFCTRLTTIRQEDVDGAPTFPTVIASLAAWLGDRDALFCSWGDYDRNQFAVDAERWAVSLPLRGHMNIKKRFSATLGETKRYGMAEALQRLGLALDGTHHRGIDDARNIARILPFAVGHTPLPT